MEAQASRDRRAGRQTSVFPSAPIHLPGYCATKSAFPITNPPPTRWYHRYTASLSRVEDMAALPARRSHHVDHLVLGDHLMVQVPARAAAQLGDDDVAVAQQVDVEVGVVDGGAADIELGHVRVQEGDDLAHGRDLERRANDDDQVHQVAVVLHQPAVELVREGLAEEGNVRLHDAAGLAAAAGCHVVLGIAGRLVVAAAAPRLLLRAVLA